MNVWVLTYLNSVGADSVWASRAQAQGRAYDLGTQGVETILEPFDVIGVPVLVNTPPPPRYLDTYTGQWVDNPPVGGDAS